MHRSMQVHSPATKWVHGRSDCVPLQYRSCPQWQQCAGWARGRAQLPGTAPAASRLAGTWSPRTARRCGRRLCMPQWLATPLPRAPTALPRCHCPSSLSISSCTQKQHTVIRQSSTEHRPQLLLLHYLAWSCCCAKPSREQFYTTQEGSTEQCRQQVKHSSCNEACMWVRLYRLAVQLGMLLVKVNQSVSQLHLVQLPDHESAVSVTS